MSHETSSAVSEAVTSRRASPKKTPTPQETANNEQFRKRLEGVLREKGVVQWGHFLLSSGRHSEVYFEKFRILQDPTLTKELVASKAEQVKESFSPTVIVGPYSGGVIVAYELAKQLGVQAMYAEKRDKGGKVLSRGFHIKPTDRVVVADDLLTTGLSLKETIVAVNDAGGEVVGAYVMIDRSQDDLDLGVDYEWSLRMKAKSYEAEKCPLCEKDQPLSDPRKKKVISFPGRGR